MIFIEGWDNGFTALTGPFTSVRFKRTQPLSPITRNGVTDRYFNSPELAGDRVLPGRNRGANWGKP
jgi:hypothetical protein